MIEKITHKKKILAIILNEKRYSNKKGINFITPDFFTIQLGFMNHPKNYVIKPHIHKNYLRKIKKTSEVLFIKSGVLRIDFYAAKKRYLFSKILKKGNIIILIEGAHGFKVIKKCSLIEIKQGPFNPLIDKTKFKEIDERKIKIKK
tara:strand:- start:1491 stop:1928 length:438 start_codon:yes stop_codon:yes gene_type:complete